jgi:hypothetical protein
MQDTVSSDLGYAVTLQDNGSVQEDTIVDVQDDYQYDNQIWIIVEVGPPTVGVFDHSRLHPLSTKFDP